MKKSAIYMNPTGENNISKIEILDLSSFRNQEKMLELSSIMGVSNIVGKAVFSSKKMDIYSPSDLAKIYGANLSSIIHPVEEYNASQQSFSSLKDIISSDKKILIYGDYDGDGITSALIFREVLKKLVSVDRILLDFSRVGEDGFGFSHRSAMFAIDTSNNIGAVVILDTGSNSEDNLKILSNAKIPTIVIDHHPLEKNTNKIKDIMYVNPHLPENVTPHPEELRNAGLIWYYSRALLKYLNVDDSFLYGYSLAMSALGTIADAGSQFEGIYNRAILKEGLAPKVLSSVPGYQEMFETDVESILSDLSFPEIAKGFRIFSLAKRMKILYADIICEYFMPETSNERREEILKDLSKKYDLFLNIADRATEKLLEEIDNTKNSVVAMADPDIVPSDFIGLSGTLASRIQSRIKKPAVIFVKDSDNTLKGSWRTGNFDGNSIISEIKDINGSIVEGYGGHAPAGGVLLKNKRNLLPFSFMFEEIVSQTSENSQRSFYNNPNVEKKFVSFIMKSSDFILKDFLDLTVITPLNRYDVSAPKILLLNVIISDIINENLIELSCVSGEKVLCSYSLRNGEYKKGDKVDIMLETKVGFKEISFSSDFMLLSDLRISD